MPALGFGGVALATATRGETVVAHASASFDPSVDASYDSYEEVAGASLSFAALSAAEREEIFAPLGVPLTPAGLASLYDGRGLHSFAFQLNLSRVCHNKRPTNTKHPLTPP